MQDGPPGSFFGFVNGELIPHLKALKDRPNAPPPQKVISEIFSGVERSRIDTKRKLLDVLDKVHEISAAAVDPTHVFTLSQAYLGLLLKMGEKANLLFFTKGRPTERIWYYGLWEHGLAVGRGGSCSGVASTRRA